jgi:hypothetical protein
MCGTAARTVFQTPVRLTSIMVDHVSSSISSVGAGVAIPALASTMSRRPSWDTPSSTALVSAARSRTSASVATMRRSSASTWRTVSARSSVVAVE